MNGLVQPDRRAIARELLLLLEVFEAFTDYPTYNSLKVDVSIQVDRIKAMLHPSIVNVMDCPQHERDLLNETRVVVTDFLPADFSDDAFVAVETQSLLALEILLSKEIRWPTRGDLRAAKSWDIEDFTSEEELLFESGETWLQTPWEPEDSGWRMNRVFAAREAAKEWTNGIEPPPSKTIAVDFDNPFFKEIERKIDGRFRPLLRAYWDQSPKTFAELKRAAYGDANVNETTVKRYIRGLQQDIAGKTDHESCFEFEDKCGIYKMTILDLPQLFRQSREPSAET